MVKLYIGDIGPIVYIENSCLIIHTKFELNFSVSTQ